jgi:hypothetical protein
MVIRQRGVMLDFSDRGQASFGALPARERDGSVQGDDRARVHLIKLIVLFGDILPIGGVVRRCQSMLGRDAGLQMIGRKLVAFGAAIELAQAFQDEFAISQ